MKKFLSNIFTFFIIVFLFNIIVFVFANDNYYKGYKDFPSKDHHTFIMADSHGITLEKFPEKYKTFNFSTSSDSYLDMKRKISYLIENNYKVNNIYLTADGHTLSKYRDKANNADRSIVYTSKIDFNYLKEKYIKYYFPVLQVKINALLKIYLISKVEKIYSKDKIPEDNFSWYLLPENEKQKRAEERLSGQFPSKIKSENLENTLLEIIHLCKENNIELIGVKFPLANSYLKMSDKNDYCADQLFILNGLKVLDYRSIFVDKQENFSDQDHLNSVGGEEFVNILLAK